MGWRAGASPRCVEPRLTLAAASSRSRSAIAGSVCAARVHAAIAWPYTAGSGSRPELSIRCSSESAPRQFLTSEAAQTIARHSLTEWVDDASVALTSAHSPARTAAHSPRSICARCLRGDGLPPTRGGRAARAARSSGWPSTLSCSGGAKRGWRACAADRGDGRGWVSTRAAAKEAETSKSKRMRVATSEGGDMRVWRLWESECTL